MLILLRTLSALSAKAEWGCSIRPSANPADKGPLKGCLLGGKHNQRMQKIMKMVSSLEQIANMMHEES